MKIIERKLAGALVLDVVGRIAGYDATILIHEVVRRHSAAGRIVVANLADVPSVDCGGLGALVEAYCTAKKAGGVLRLAGVTTRIHDLLVLTRLLTVFETFDSVEEAARGAASAPDIRDTPRVSMATLGAIHRFLRRA